MKRLYRFLVCEDGVAGAEYGIMLAMIAVVLLASVALLGEQADGIWTGITFSLDDALKTTPP